MTDDGLFVEATNSVAKKWFRGIDELLVHDQFKHRMLSNLLMLAYVPAGRLCWVFVFGYLGVCLLVGRPAVARSCRAIVHLHLTKHNRPNTGMYTIPNRLVAPKDRLEFSTMIMTVSLCKLDHHITRIIKVRYARRSAGN